MFQSEMHLDKRSLQTLAVTTWPEKLTVHVVCLEMMDTMGVLLLVLHLFACASRQ